MQYYKLYRKALILFISTIGIQLGYSNCLTESPKAFELKGKVVDFISGIPIGNANVLITNIRNDFSKEISTDDDGFFSTKLIAESVFSVMGFKNRHFHSEQFSISTIGREFGEEIELNIKLMAMELGHTYPIAIDFYPNDFSLSEETEEQLDKLFIVMAKNRDVVLEVGCHTDSRGDDSHNLELSQQRAQTAVNYLIRKGISKLRLQPRGYGELEPVNACVNGVRCSFTEHGFNRRTELKIIAFIE